MRRWTGGRHGGRLGKQEALRHPWAVGLAMVSLESSFSRVLEEGASELGGERGRQCCGDWWDDCPAAGAARAGSVKIPLH